MSAGLKKATEFATRAAELVGGDRAKTHGTKLENFTKIATLWNAYLTIRREPAAPLDAGDHAMMMVLLKIARTQHGGFNLDDLIDMAGYSTCAAEVMVAIEDAAEAERAEMAALGVRVKRLFNPPV